MTERRRLISRAKIANGIARLFSLSFYLFLSLFLSLFDACTRAMTITTPLCLVIRRAKGDRVEGRGRWTVELLFNRSVDFWSFEQKQGKGIFRPFVGKAQVLRGVVERAWYCYLSSLLDGSFQGRRGIVNLFQVVRNILVRVHPSMKVRVDGCFLWILLD